MLGLLHQSQTIAYFPANENKTTFPSLVAQPLSDVMAPKERARESMYDNIAPLPQPDLCLLCIPHLSFPTGELLYSGAAFFMSPCPSRQSARTPPPIPGPTGTCAKGASCPSMWPPPRRELGTSTVSTSVRGRGTMLSGTSPVQQLRYTCCEREGLALEPLG